MPKNRKLHLDDVLFAADATKGNISRSAERLSVTRWALQLYLRRTPRAAEAFHEWQQKLVDAAQEALWECVASKAPWAIALVLKSRNGASRGWTDAELSDRRHTAILLQSARELGLSATELIVEMEDMFESLDRHEVEPPGYYAKKLAALRIQAAALEQSLKQSWPQAPPPVAAPAPAPAPAPTMAPSVVVPDEPEEAAMEAELRELIALAKRRLGV